MNITLTTTSLVLPRANEYQYPNFLSLLEDLEIESITTQFYVWNQLNLKLIKICSN